MQTRPMVTCKRCEEKYPLGLAKLHKKTCAVQPVKRRRLPQCECGNEKPLVAEACDRCQWLDGNGHREKDVIAALRACDDHADTDALELETGMERTALLHLMVRLVKKGRVRRVIVSPSMFYTRWDREAKKTVLKVSNNRNHTPMWVLVNERRAEEKIA